MPHSLFFFFFNDTATTEIYTLSLHDALPIFGWLGCYVRDDDDRVYETYWTTDRGNEAGFWRSEEHTSELQSHLNLVCRLLLEKKKMISVAILIVASLYYMRQCTCAQYNG